MDKLAILFHGCMESRPQSMLHVSTKLLDHYHCHIKFNKASYSCIHFPLYNLDTLYTHNTKKFYFKNWEKS